jgi:hypothetical protein
MFFNLPLFILFTFEWLLIIKLYYGRYYVLRMDLFGKCMGRKNGRKEEETLDPVTLPCVWVTLGEGRGRKRGKREEKEEWKATM